MARVEHGGASFLLVRVPAIWNLTKRQQAIASLVAEGLPNKDIAHRLGISLATVASHLGRIYRKVHVDSRVALAGQAPWMLWSGVPTEGSNS